MKILSADVVTGGLGRAATREASEVAEKRRGADSGSTMDEQEFIEFHRQTEKPFWGYLARLTGSPQGADDLCQESYLRLLSRTELPEDFQARKAYLFRIGSRLVIDGSRRRRFEGPWSEAKEPMASTAPGENVDLARAMAQLKPRQRALVWLAYVEQYSHEEIADILGLAKLSVRVLLSRARKRLSRELEQSGSIPGASS